VCRNSFNTGRKAAKEQQIGVAPGFGLAYSSTYDPETFAPWR